ncbi:MarR family winged helix-turn-helix transcriptional regulator [Kribbella amoyensis]|uniref:MarR family winged helix-turn-helix transcriptional regulator n=1 Tax=Kribbella amoyensis TaxID=996641 RepID=UPI001EE1621B|nr:MarR family winged helix-turn-helix transcriptional regulator [Kribbella amoyensis]
MDEEAVQLMVAMHRIVRHLRRSAMSETLHPTQFITLLVIADEQPVRIGTIAARVPCSQPTATTTVATLEADGLVCRQGDDRDGRATVVVLTDLGAEMVAQIRADATKTLEGMLTELDDEDRAQVLRSGGVLYRLSAGL